MSRTFDVSKYIRYITIKEDTDKKSKVSTFKIFAIYYQDSKAVKISVIKSGYIVNCICNAWLQKLPEQTQTVTSSPANASLCVWHFDSTGMLSVISITVIRVSRVLVKKCIWLCFGNVIEFSMLIREMAFVFHKSK